MRIDKLFIQWSLRLYLFDLGDETYPVDLVQREKRLLIEPVTARYFTEGSVLLDLPQ